MTTNINDKSKALYFENQAAVDVKETFDATDIIRTSNLEATIYDGETVTIDYDGGSGRNALTKHTTQYNKFSFEMDLIGGGDAGAGEINDPPAADVIRACGFDMALALPPSHQRGAQTGEWFSVGGGVSRPNPGSRDTSAVAG